MKHTLVILCVCGLLAACAPVEKKLAVKTTPLRDAIQSSPLNVDAAMPGSSAAQAVNQTKFEIINRPRQRGFILGADDDKRLPQLKSIQPVSLNIENVPIPAFINEIFGSVLGLDFALEPALQKQPDLVTLRLSEPKNAKELFLIARQVLDKYGVRMILRDNNVIDFVTNAQSSGLEPPLLISGKSLPSVPATHRTVFYFLPLEVASHYQVLQWIQAIYPNNPDLEIKPDGIRNGIMLKGKSALVESAAKAIKLLDRPMMQERLVARIEPVFIPVQELQKQVSKILLTEGYSVTEDPGRPGVPILLLAFEKSNALLVFAPREDTLEYVRELVNTLDQPGPQPEKTSDIYFYPVQHSSAENLLSVLTGVTNKTNPPGGHSLMADNTRNLILFNGAPEKWRRLLRLIKQLDTPPKSVLIEMIIAEVTLTDSAGFGIEWLLRDARIGGLSGSLGTLDALGVGGSGLSYFPVSSSGQTLAVLNAFANDSRVTILSTPRLVVRSGEEASIDVGTEVPVVTSQATAPDLQMGGDSAILQQVQYRRTGNLMQVKPIIYGSNQVDLTIQQEISEAQGNSTSGIDSPIILNRKISTVLTVPDGGSVLLGGLITESQSQSTSGVPGLSDIPILGHLFRADKTERTRTELLALIIPYVLDNSAQAEEITKAFQERLQFIDIPKSSVPESLESKPTDQSAP
jgi:general secretion pathway protein D